MRDWHKIEMYFGQTPCLCGDVETWHKKCYAEKSDEEIKAASKKAFDMARLKMKREVQLDAQRRAERLIGRAKQP